MVAAAKTPVRRRPKYRLIPRNRLVTSPATERLKEHQKAQAAEEKKRLADLKKIKATNFLERNITPKDRLVINKMSEKILVLASHISGKKFYDYQIECALRMIESVLLHDGSVISILMSRQSGKTEILSNVVAALKIALPYLCKKYPDNYLLNLEDENGNYRGYRDGFRAGIYAPRLDQASIMFDRIKSIFDSDRIKPILEEFGLVVPVNNGRQTRLSNGSRLLCESASEQSKIEGETHNLLILEEAQDISDKQVRKSLHPMVAATGGTIVKIGTASFKKCDFYETIRHNKRMEMVSGTKNNFFYPYQVCKQFNSIYAVQVEKDKLYLGENSDEFRTAYCGEWIFERGMFVSDQQLYATEVSLTSGLFSETMIFGLPNNLPQYSVVMGIDWGSSNDSTVVTLMAVDWKNPLESGYYTDAKGEHSYTHYRKHVLGWIEYQGDDYETQFNEIYTFIENHWTNGLAKIIMDSNTCGKPMFDRFSSVFRGRKIQVEEFNFNAALKSDGYKAFAQDLSGRRITFPAGPRSRKTPEFNRFVTQMLDLQKEYKNGRMHVAHPDSSGARDDYPDSTMLANWGANNPAGASGIEVFRHNYIFARP